MKKFVSIVLALSLVLSLAACGGKKTQETEAAALKVEGSMEELLNKTIEQRPVEFMGGVIPMDLTDSSEDGLWALKSYTGLDDAAKITEAAAFEPAGDMLRGYIRGYVRRVYDPEYMQYIQKIVLYIA